MGFLYFNPLDPIQIRHSSANLLTKLLVHVSFGLLSLSQVRLDADVRSAGDGEKIGEEGNTLGISAVFITSIDDIWSAELGNDKSWESPCIITTCRNSEGRTFIIDGRVCFFLYMFITTFLKSLTVILLGTRCYQPAGKEKDSYAMEIADLDIGHTVDGPAKSHKPPIWDGWNPINSGINYRFQLVIWILQPSTIPPIYWWFYSHSHLVI